MMQVTLWRFPEADFPLWRQDCAEKDDFTTYAEYIAGVEKIASELGRQGLRIHWLTWGVQRVLDELKKQGKPNTSSNRAELFSTVSRSRDKLGAAIRGAHPKIDAEHGPH